MKGLILAAGRSRRMRDLTTANKVLLELGPGCSILENLLDRFDGARVSPTLVVAGFAGANVRKACAGRASVLLNPFHTRFGILASIWRAREDLYASPFVVTVGDHYIEDEEFGRFLGSQPEADVLLHVELKECDDEDMKVFVDHTGRLRTISKGWNQPEGTAIGEFSGLIRFSSSGSRFFFDMLDEYAWTHGLDGERYLADVLLACHLRRPLAFHLSNHHRRVDIDFPTDYERACRLYQEWSSRSAKSEEAGEPAIERSAKEIGIG